MTTKGDPVESGLESSTRGIGDTLMETGEGRWLVGNRRDDADISKRCLLTGGEDKRALGLLEWWVWMWGNSQEQREIYGADSNRALLFPYPLNAVRTHQSTHKELMGQMPTTQNWKWRHFTLMFCLRRNGKEEWAVCFKDQKAPPSW